MTLQAPQRRTPELSVIAQPVVHGAQRHGVERAEPGGTALGRAGQPERPQHPKMLGDCRPAGAEIGGDLPDAARAAAQHAENLAPRRIGDRPKDCCLSALYRNHMVTYM